MKYTLIILFLLCAPAAFAPAQQALQVRGLLDQASARYDVPRALLYAVAYTESRWRHVPWDAADALSCTGMPKSHGLMGLHDDRFFGASLRGGQAIGITPQMADTGLRENIMLGAYYLSGLFNGTDRTDLNQWIDPLGRYSGIPQPALRLLYADGVFQAMRRGWVLDGVVVAPAQAPAVNTQALESGLRTLGMKSAGPDYPQAVWTPSPNFSDRNSPILAITIHDTEGNFAGSLAWLTDTAAQASAHYMIRSIDGYTVQMVQEKDKAWHVRTENPYTVGIEHEGYVSKPEFFTPVMYQTSAALVRYLRLKYHISLSRTVIKGHLDYPNNTHTDPGGWWNWPAYYRLVSGYPGNGVVIDEFEDNVVGWWQPGMSGSTTGADTALTVFDIAAEARQSGGYGGRLRYAFSGASGGVIRLFRSGHGNTSDGLLNVGRDGYLSLWVNGTPCGHALELWLYDSASKANIIVPAGTVDWNGWRSVAVNIGALNQNSSLRFNSVVLRQLPGGSASGTLMVDELMHTVAAPSGVRGGAGASEQVLTVQPQPVRDHALLRWQSAGGALVTACDIHGREVLSTRVDAAEYLWDTGTVPAGTYIVTIVAAGNIMHARVVVAR